MMLPSLVVALVTVVIVLAPVAQASPTKAPDFNSQADEKKFHMNQGKSDHQLKNLKFKKEGRLSRDFSSAKRERHGNAGQQRPEKPFNSPGSVPPKSSPQPINVPEPEMLPLLGLGFVALILWQYWSRRKIGTSGQNSTRQPLS
jgi:hypothetical protein